MAAPVGTLIASTTPIRGIIPQLDDHFVSPTGTASWSGSLEVVTPCSPVTAFANAAAGDVVWFRGGTYNFNSAVTITGHDGTTDAPVIFVAYPGETATLENTSAGGAATMILLNQAYTRFDGFDLYASVINNAGFFYVGSSGASANFCTFTNLTATIDTFTGNDNESFITTHTTGYGLMVKNCRFTQTNPKGLTESGGPTAIKFYATEATAIENCEFYGIIGANAAAIEQKFPNALSDSSMTWRNNYFKDCSCGIATRGNYTAITNNLFVNCDSGVYGFPDGTGAYAPNYGGDYNVITHNTFVGCSVGFSRGGGGADPLPGCCHNVIRNNILGATAYLDPWTTPAIPQDYQSDYNLFPASAAVYRALTSYDLAAWRAANGTDAHSLSGAPTFVGGMGIAAYALAPGSLGKNAADDDTDMGCDVASVGVQ
jgi:hypothetical protein